MNAGQAGPGQTRPGCTARPGWTARPGSTARARFDRPNPSVDSPARFDSPARPTLTARPPGHPTESHLIVVSKTAISCRRYQNPNYTARLHAVGHARASQSPTHTPRRYLRPPGNRLIVLDPRLSADQSIRITISSTGRTCRSQSLPGPPSTMERPCVRSQQIGPTWPRVMQMEGFDLATAQP